MAYPFIRFHPLPYSPGRESRKDFRNLKISTSMKEMRVILHYHV